MSWMNEYMTRDVSPCVPMARYRTILDHVIFNTLFLQDRDGIVNGCLWQKPQSSLNCRICYCSLAFFQLNDIFHRWTAPAIHASNSCCDGGRGDSNQVICFNTPITENRFYRAGLNIGHFLEPTSALIKITRWQHCHPPYGFRLQAWRHYFG